MKFMLMSALYAIGIACTTIQLRGHAEESTSITIYHDNGIRVNAAEIPGNGTSDHYIVNHRDVFMIVGRQGGNVVASGIFMVDREVAASCNTLLVPCTLQNLAIDQADGAIFDRAFEHALEAACADTAIVEAV